MNKFFLTLIFVLIPPSMALATVSYNCNLWNYQTGVSTATYYGIELHISGNHTFEAHHVGSCSYGMAPSGGGNCPLYVSAADNPSGFDDGLVSSSTHVYRFAAQGGSTSGLGPLAAQAKSGMAVETCFFGVCNFTVTLGAAGSGVTVSSGGAIFSREDVFTANCVAKTMPYNSPIIIDTVGEGFRLTDIAHGVFFDIRGNNRPVKIAWTAPGSHNAFLAIDNDGDGKIDSGKELFGNWSPQGASEDPNGFLALAEYDKPQNGGNGDGVIDARDRVFSKLRLWIDANHDGVAQANELYLLPSLGVRSISLRYSVSMHSDAFDNVFRFEGSAHGSQNLNPEIWDVFLQSAPN